MGDRKTRAAATGERGATLIFVALCMFALLAVTALAVDLGMLYVGRNQAQRAADAAALAGAKSISESACFAADDCTPTSGEVPPATEEADTVAAQNLVLNLPPTVTSVGFSFPSGYEPQITVTVERTGIPLFFAKIFGSSYSTVAAKATAEAYNGATQQGCLVPFLVPNCGVPYTTPVGGVTNDRCYVFQGNSSPPTAYTAAPYLTTAYKFISTGGQGDTIPAGQPYTWPIGQTWTLHYSDTIGVPSQFYMLDFTSSNSGSVINSEIKNCYTGSAVDPSDPQSNVIETATGNKASIVKSVESRIYAAGDGLGQGQDSLVSPVQSSDWEDWYLNPLLTYEPLSTAYGSLGVTTQSDASLAIAVGLGNPLTQATPGLPAGSIYTQSPSIVTVPIYNYVDMDCAGQSTGSCSQNLWTATTAPGETTALNPGQNEYVQIIGFLRVFIVDAYHLGTEKAVDVVILGVSGYGSTPSPVYAENGPPIRLIQAPTASVVY